MFGGTDESGSGFSLGGQSAESRVSGRDKCFRSASWTDTAGGLQSDPTPGFSRRWRRAGRTRDEVVSGTGDISDVDLPPAGAWTSKPTVVDVDE